MNDDIPTCSFCAATVKPDVVFFGEDLPQKYFLHTEDFPKADLLIVMGTSLQVNLLERAIKSNAGVLVCRRQRPFLVLDRAIRQLGEHRALHGATPPPEPARRRALREGPLAERRPHGAGGSGGDRRKVRRTSGLERGNRRTDEEAGSAGGFRVYLDQIS